MNQSTDIKHDFALKAFYKRKVDYKETFAPVIRYDSIRVLFALATINDVEIKQFDVKTVFLYGELLEEVFMKQKV